MKKLLTGILAIGLAASMSIPAFAANKATNDGTAGTDITVNGKYNAGPAAAEVISVDLVWDEMNFTYTAPSKGTWNPGTHEYENQMSGGWEATGGTNPKIAVTNHSNTEIKADFAFNGTVEGLIGNFTKNMLVLDSAVGTEFEKAPKGETTFSVDGTAIDADKDIGTITVTVGKFGATPQIVSTAAELLETVDKIDVFKLANDIDLGSETLYIATDRYVLDLNGYTLSSSISDSLIIVEEGATLTVKNGSLTNTAGKVLNNGFGTVTVEGCTLTSGYDSYVISNSGKMFVKDSVLHGLFGEQYTVMVENSQAFAGKYGELTLSGNVQMDGSINVFKYMDPVAPTVKALEGTYNFDVSSYVDTTLYDVTNDGTTWTVTAK